MFLAFCECTILWLGEPEITASPGGLQVVFWGWQKKDHVGSFERAANLFCVSHIEIQVTSWKSYFLEFVFFCCSDCWSLLQILPQNKSLLGSARNIESSLFLTILKVAQVYLSSIFSFEPFTQFLKITFFSPQFSYPNILMFFGKPSMNPLVRSTRWAPPL